MLYNYRNLIILVLIIIGLIILISSNNNVFKDNTNVGGSIWLHSNDMKKVNLDSLEKQNITSIFINSRILEVYNDDEVSDFISECHENNISVHLSISTFRFNDKFQVPTSDVQEARLKYIEKCSSTPNIDGINLDYIRYNGKNKAIVNENTITEFVKKARNITDNNNVELSLCIMPEKEKSISNYGQNVHELSKYCDTIMPMAYKGNYNKNSTWISEITKYYKENSECKVVTIIQTYESDNKLIKLSNSELLEDIRAVYHGNANGCSLFKYGYLEQYNE